jgi:hypothetical protein
VTDETKGPLAPFRFQENVMSQKSAAKRNPEPSAKVVVFGLDSNWRPRAAWFPHTQADQARAAAKQLRLNVIDVANGTGADLVGKLPAGQIHAAGPAMVPPVREDLYAKVVATINPHGEAGQDPGKPITPDFPKAYWDGIKPGHVVLAQDSLIQGWYEAVVVSRTADKLTLRCRDYPVFPNFTVPVMTVALVNPTGS